MQKIILLRHGEVDIKDYENISANQFEKWIIEYNNSNIKSKVTSKNEIKNLLNETDVLICSNLKRSIQSIEIFDKIPFETNDIFNEAELPHFTWNLLKLNPKVWLIFFRILWFFGYPAKAKNNLSKHRISFEDATSISFFKDKELIELNLIKICI